MKQALHILLLCVLCSLAATAEESSYLRIVSYNTENLFHPDNDSLTLDDDFTPEGRYHWTPGRYYEKLHHLTEVITAIGGWQRPAIVGLMEVEDDQCLADLSRSLRIYGRPDYCYLHHDGPDQRGIDVALLYDSTQVTLLSCSYLPVDLGEGNRPTREILLGEFVSSASDDTLACFICHFPSQLGGAAASQYRRDSAWAVLNRAVDSILYRFPDALILAMGDFNSAPRESVPNLSYLAATSDIVAGTHYYQGHWSSLDQFYASPSLIRRCSNIKIFASDWLLENDDKYLQTRPRRTYIGPRYHGGYSDHLPIYLDIR